MFQHRVIPILLLKNSGLVKGVNFKSHKYVGDAMNSIRIFNNKKVDELLLVDITATKRNCSIDPDFVARVADECYMPFGVGGGIRTTDQIKKLIRAGAEKVNINSGAVSRPQLIREASEIFGSQCIVVGIDYRRDLFGRMKVFTHCGNKKTKRDPISWAQEAESLGAGEILLTCIDRDGVQEGYDLETLSKITASVSIPVIASGGAGKTQHFQEAFAKDAHAVAAGSMFVFKGKHRSVLVQYFK
jgi:cyclase